MRKKLICVIISLFYNINHKINRYEIPYSFFQRRHSSRNLKIGQWQTHMRFLDWGYTSFAGRIKILFQTEVNEPDKQKTAFKQETWGVTFLMIFLLVSAIPHLHFYESGMGDLNLRHCLIYRNDIFTTSYFENLRRLDEDFTPLEEQINLKLKALKCDFFKSKVIYLGHNYLYGTICYVVTENKPLVYLILVPNSMQMVTVR